jgi:hypothetical protein
MLSLGGRLKMRQGTQNTGAPGRCDTTYQWTATALLFCYGACATGSAIPARCNKLVFSSSLPRSYAQGS